MDPNRFTEKAREALASAQTNATRLDHQQIDLEHLLLALLNQERGLVPAVLSKANVAVEPLRSRLDAELARLPKVTGPSGAVEDQRVSGRLNKALTTAEDEAKQLRDEYVSVEHFLLGMIPDKLFAGTLLRDAGLTRDRVLSILKDIRGGQRVTSANPEDSFQALEKYGRDLTLAAEQGKLDPVIGRDEEIPPCCANSLAADQKQPRAHRRTRRRAKPRSSKVWRPASSAAMSPKA